MRDLILCHCRKILIMAVLCFLGSSGFACKLTSKSSSKSFVGLSARVAGGNAPSFNAVSEWFESAAGAQTNLGEQIFAQTPDKLRAGLVAYAEQQMQRIRDFQVAEKDPARLGQLLAREADDLLEIILALADPGFLPDQANDIFAKLLSQPGMRGIVDQSAMGALWKIFQTDIGTLKRELPIEHRNFLTSLQDLYVDQRLGAKPQFISDLRRNCGWLTNFMQQAGRPVPEGARCQGDPATVASGAAPRFYRIFGSMMQAQSNLEQFRQLNPGMNPFAVNPNLLQPGNPLSQGSPVGIPLPGGGNQFCPPNFAPAFGGCQPTTYLPHMPLAFNWFAPGAGNSNISVNPLSYLEFEQSRPNFDSGQPSCIDRFGPNSRIPDPNALATCQRYGDGVPMDQLDFQTFNPAGPGNVSVDSRSPFAAAMARRQNRDENTLFVNEFGTPVQNQGREGSCTAYGMTHAAVAARQPLEPGFNYDAEKQWSAQGRSTTYSVAVSTAKETGLIANARKIEKDREAIRSTLDSGRPIFAACGTGGRWSGVGRSDPTVNCVTQGQYGHAFAIVGYSRDGYVIKNSYGEGWGAQGYATVPYGQESFFSTLYAVEPVGEGVLNQ